MVPRRTAHVLEIVVLARNAHAFLNAGGASIVAHVLAQKNALELHHPRVGEHERGIAFRHKQARGHHAMVPLLEEAQERFSQLAAGHRERGYQQPGLPLISSPAQKRSTLRLESSVMLISESSDDFSKSSQVPSEVAEMPLKRSAKSSGFET